MKLKSMLVALVMLVGSIMVFGVKPAAALPTGCSGFILTSGAFAICKGGTGSYQAVAKCVYVGFGSGYAPYYAYAKSRKAGSGQYSVAICGSLYEVLTYETRKFN